MSHSRDEIDSDRNLNFSFPKKNISIPVILDFDSLQSFLDFFESLGLSDVIMNSVEAALVITANVLLFAIIITSRTLRWHMRNWLVVSLTVMNLVTGVLSCALLSGMAVGVELIQWGCSSRLMFDLFLVFIQDFVTLWGMVLLLLHYFCKLRGYPGSGLLERLPTWARRSVIAVYIALPWIVSVAVIAPVVVQEMHMWTVFLCQIYLNIRDSVLLGLIVYFLPALILIGLVIAIVVVAHGPCRRDATDTECGTLSTRSRMPRTDSQSVLIVQAESLEGPRVHAVSAFLTVALLAPENCIYFLKLHSVDLNLKRMIIVSTVARHLGHLLSFLLCVNWLVFLPDVRARIQQLRSRVLRGLRKCTSPLESSASSHAPMEVINELVDESIMQ